VLVPCSHEGCGENVPRGTRYCDKHRGAPANSLASDPVREWYNSPPWRRLSLMVRSKNPLCQKLVNGRQCMSPSRICHHRLSPWRRRDLFLSVYDENGVSQLIALCMAHHPDVDTPDWIEGKDFCRTEFQLSIV